MICGSKALMVLSRAINFDLLERTAFTWVLLALMTLDQVKVLALCRSMIVSNNGGIGLRKLFVGVLAFLFGVAQISVAAHADTGSSQGPFAGPTYTATTWVRSSATSLSGKLFLTVPQTIDCKIDRNAGCSFQAYLYTALPNETGLGYNGIIGTYAGSIGKHFFAPTESAGKTVNLYVYLASPSTRSVDVQFRETTLNLNLNVIYPKNYKAFTSKLLNKPCKSSDFSTLGHTSSSYVNCQYVGNKTLWTALVPDSGLIGNAAFGCGLNSTYALLGDNQNTLSLSGVFLDRKISESEWNCVVKILRIPLAVTEQISHTRALDGRQNATWGAYSASWTYHPDQGLNIIFNKK